jgi:hypothetical protein
VGKEENENMWEILGLFRGFKQRRNWGENNFPVGFIAHTTGIIKLKVTNLKKNLRSLMLLLHLVLFVPVSKVEITLQLALNEANVKRQTQGTSYFLLNYWREEENV